MEFLGRLYRLFNYLSLDVACGAMVCAAFFSHILRVQLRPYGLASLGITVWIIYTVDHLLDARKLKQDASSQRHRFHQQYFWKLFYLLIAAVFIDLLLIFFVRKPILNWGFALTFMIIPYLLFQHRLRYLKELVISLLYSAGVLLPAMSLTTLALTINEIIIITLFVCTAFINLVLFSWFDWEEDLTDNHSSLVTFLGRDFARKILIALFLMQAIFIVDLILNSGYPNETLTLAAMNVVLFALFLFPEKLSTKNLYRIIGDAVFLFPIPYLFLSK